MVLRLAGQLAEHLVDTDQLTDTHVELERLVHTLPAAPYQRDRGPSQWLLRMLATQTERTELVPLIDALNRRMRAEKVMDFGMQMASAARLASTFPQVGEQLRRRFRVVLLDEYQDTGHAQRVALSSLFGGGVDDDLALTAVGDPIQSIYGWRGASATNLPRFTTDFPRSDGSPAPTLELRTSWRNPPTALYLANAVSAEARRRSVAVQALRPRPGAEPGTIRCALLADVAAERDWVADHIARRYHGARDAGTPCRRRRCWCGATPTPRRWPMRSLPAVCRWRSSDWRVCSPSPRSPTWWPCCAWSPTPARARPRCGCSPARDGGLAAATSRRCGAAPSTSTTSAGRRIAHRPTRSSPRPRPTPTPPAWPTRSAIRGRRTPTRPEGHRRITALGHELTGLRAHLVHPLPDLVAEVRRVLGVDAEARAARPPSAGWSGTEHLDAFADVVADFAAARPGAAVVRSARLPGCRGGGGERAGSRGGKGATVAHDRVQILTVHAAKGLEWQVVAVPHLSGRVFPSTASTRTWLTDAADLPPLLRGDRATLGAHGVPVLDTSDVNDRKQLSDKISEHKRRLDQRRVDEERRLLYVALTRAEDTLLLSGHHWGASEAKPRGPSEFLCELKEIIDGSAAGGRPVRGGRTLGARAGRR